VSSGNSSDALRAQPALVSDQAASRLAPSGFDQAQFTLAEILGALSDIYKIKGVGWTAFAARVRNLRRLGWPDGINGRAGVSTLYTEEQALDIAFAVELSAIGFSPERAIEICRGEREQFHDAVRYEQSLMLKLPGIHGMKAEATLFVEAFRFSRLAISMGSVS